MRNRLAVGLLLCPFVLAGCHRSAEPVARLRATQRQLELPHGMIVPLELGWEPMQPLPAGVTAPIAFVHLVDQQDNVVRTFDHVLTGRWQVGETLTDRVSLYHSAIGPALPPADYRLVVGLYDGKETRFGLQVEGEEIRHQEYVVAQVRVPEVSATAPAFTFSPEWQTAEPGNDRQSVARRWLSGDGSLEARGLPPLARIWMVVRIPKVEPPLRLLLEPGAAQPTAQVSADCGVGFSADVTGEGTHELAVPVRASGACHIAFDTNYTVVEMGTGRKLALELDQLGWEPGDPGTLAPGTP